MSAMLPSGWAPKKCDGADQRRAYVDYLAQAALLRYRRSRTDATARLTNKRRVHRTSAYVPHHPSRRPNVRVPPTLPTPPGLNGNAF